jgi:hypothetical protein
MVISPNCGRYDLVDANYLEVLGQCCTCQGLAVSRAQAPIGNRLFYIAPGSVAGLAGADNVVERVSTEQLFVSGSMFVLGR